MRFKYDTLQITGVDEDEKAEWRAKAYKLGYHTLTDYLKEILTDYKEMGYESKCGFERVVISSFSAKDIECSDLKKRSRAVRYFINQKTKG